MKWVKMKLGDVLKNREGRYKPDDPTIVGLKRIDKINFSGQIFLSDKSSNTDMILIKKGDLVISGINVEKGALTVYEGEEDILATIHYSSYIFDTSKIDIDFLKVFLRSPDFVQLLKEQVPGGIKTEIKPKHILPLEVYFPETTTEQKIIAEHFFEKEAKFNQLDEHISYQLALIDQLNQAILQEAVQGKLLKSSPPLKEGKPTGGVVVEQNTSYLPTGGVVVEQNTSYLPTGGVVVEQNTREKLLRDPSVLRTAPLAGEQHEEEETGHELLKRIKAEKAKLGKKEKPLPPIKPEEIPFEIPSTWVWCRLGEISSFGPTNGYSPVANKIGKGVKCLTLTATTSGKFKSEFYKFVDVNIPLTSHLWLSPNDILIQRGNSLDYVGVSAIYESTPNKFIYPDLMVKVRFPDEIFSKFVYYFLLSPFVRNYFRENASGAQQSMPKINQGVINNTLLAIPPLSEQKRIVAEIEKQFAKTKQLKEHIIANQQATEQLLKTLLHQAFEVGEIKKSKSRRD